MTSLNAAASTPNSITANSVHDTTLESQIWPHPSYKKVPVKALFIGSSKLLIHQLTNIAVKSTVNKIFVKAVPSAAAVNAGNITGTSAPLTSFLNPTRILSLS